MSTTPRPATPPETAAPPPPAAASAEASVAAAVAPPVDWAVPPDPPDPAGPQTSGWTSGWASGRASGRGAVLAVAGLAVVALLAALTTAVLVNRHRGGPTGPLANRRPTPLPSAVASAPRTVTAADGRTLPCPAGAEPAIVLDSGTFTPPLVNGQLLGKGRYHIRLAGSVQNETSAAIVVNAVTVYVDDRPWAATVTVAPRLDAQSSADLVIEGTYTSPRAGTPALHAQLDWQWQSSDLLPCGDAGLIEDD